ncbi:MAG TPA: LLM class flavin-dependent oxidoreductase [Candidatus Tectomicrobia bacterium]|nr:LLM class flavin-dependent oxidoreductase [Candidatus Tectomicrobia bacterium]
MPQKLIGVAMSAFGATGSAPDGPAILANIEHAEQLGIPAAWLTTGGTGLDALTLFAAAAVRTSQIRLGTSIVPTFPRHPLVAVQQVQVLAQLAPGRFRLGLGPSHRPTMESTFGFDFRAPLGHLREYVQIVKTLLSQGSVDFDGEYYHAHGQIRTPVDVPVMASALQRRSFEFCGEATDGAISWVCPGVYLRDVALPAMRAGAEKVGRPVPPLLAHAPVCVHDKPDEVRAAAQQQLANYVRLPFYIRMFTAAGFPEAAAGSWSDAMIEAVVFSGDESRVADRLHGMFALGATEILVSPLVAGSDRAASVERTLRLVAEVAKSVGR